MRAVLPLLILICSPLISCSPANVASDKPEALQLCRDGYARACATEYKKLYGAGKTNEAEKLYADLCKMPKVLCYRLRPDENLAQDTAAYERLVELDVWSKGRVTEKRVVLFHSVDVNADRLN